MRLEWIKSFVDGVLTIYDKKILIMGTLSVPKKSDGLDRNSRIETLQISIHMTIFGAIIFSTTKMAKLVDSQKLCHHYSESSQFATLYGSL